MNFENNVKVFDKKAQQDVSDIFRNTRYNDRKRVRLQKWQHKKYKKRHGNRDIEMVA